MNESIVKALKMALDKAEIRLEKAHEIREFLEDPNYQDATVENLMHKYVRELLEALELMVKKYHDGAISVRKRIDEYVRENNEH